MNLEYIRQSLDSFTSLEQLIDVLPNLEQVIFKSKEGDNIYQLVEDVTDKAIDIIASGGKERDLYNKLVDKQREVILTYESKISAAQEAQKEIRRQLEQARATLSHSQQRLKAVKSNVKSSEENRLQLEEFQKWKHACDKEQLEIRDFQYKIGLLDEQRLLKSSQGAQVQERNELYYNFIISCLKIYMVDANEEEVNLAVLSESKHSENNAWHRIVVSLKECNVKTCDYLWNTVQEALTDRAGRRDRQ